MNRNGTNPQSPDTDLVCVGAVAGAFGVHGDIRVKAFTDDPLACAQYGPLRNALGKVILTPGKARIAKKDIIFKAPEITNREAAEALRGEKLYVARKDLPPPDEDEFYYSDLLGLDARDDKGDTLGKIKAIHNFGGGDMLEIQPSTDKPSRKSWYHPFTREAVPEIELSRGFLVLHIEEPDVARADKDEENDANET